MCLALQQRMGEPMIYWEEEREELNWEKLGGNEKSGSRRVRSEKGRSL